MSRIFRGIILAGDRAVNDPLRRYSGVESKAMIPIGGKPMIHRVIQALQSASSIKSVSLSGPSEKYIDADQSLSGWREEGALAWYPSESSPSTSAFSMLSIQPQEDPVLITTADHPLLSGEIVDCFCNESAQRDCDVIVGLAPYDIISATYPELRKTVLRFRDGAYCGCNLFAFLTPKGRQIADFWCKIEDERKKPLLLIRLLGWRAVLKYRLGLLSLDAALSGLSRRLDLRIGAVILPYANAGVDVDSVADYNVLRHHFVDTDTAMQLPAK